MAEKTKHSEQAIQKGLPQVLLILLWICFHFHSMLLENFLHLIIQAFRPQLVASSAYP